MRILLAGLLLLSLCSCESLDRLLGFDKKKDSPLEQRRVVVRGQTKNDYDRVENLPAKDRYVHVQVKKQGEEDFRTLRFDEYGLDEEAGVLVFENVVDKDPGGGLIFTETPVAPKGSQYEISLEKR